MHDNTRNELKRRAQEDDKLYERFARNLGQEHRGGFVAVFNRLDDIIPELRHQ